MAATRPTRGQTEPALLLSAPNSTTELEFVAKTWNGIHSETKKRREQDAQARLNSVQSLKGVAVKIFACLGGDDEDELESKILSLAENGINYQAILAPKDALSLSEWKKRNDYSSEKNISHHLMTLEQYRQQQAWPVISAMYRTYMQEKLSNSATKDDFSRKIEGSIRHYSAKNPLSSREDNIEHAIGDTIDVLVASLSNKEIESGQLNEAQADVPLNVLHYKRSLSPLQFDALQHSKQLIGKVGTLVHAVIEARPISLESNNTLQQGSEDVEAELGSAEEAVLAMKDVLQAAKLAGMTEEDGPLLGAILASMSRKNGTVSHKNNVIPTKGGSTARMMLQLEAKPSQLKADQDLQLAYPQHRRMSSDPKPQPISAARVRGYPFVGEMSNAAINDISQPISKIKAPR